MAKIRRRTRQLIRPVKKNCPFCQAKKAPHWRDYQELGKFLSSRSRILPRTRTGVCALHQRRLSEVIKQARHLGLLPFITRINK